MSWQDVQGYLSEEEGNTLARLAKGKRVLEVGTYKGRSTCCMAQTAAHIVAVDPQATHYGDCGFEAVANLYREAPSRSWQVIRGRIQEVAAMLPLDHFDGMFLDASHDLLGTIDEYNAALPLLKIGAWVAFHDYSPFDTSSYPGVSQACRIIFPGREPLDRVHSLAVFEVEDKEVRVFQPIVHICGIVRDEMDLPEWVDYHLAMGIDHIYLYDNESTVPVRETLSEWIKKGLVSVEEIEGRGRQTYVYARYGRRAAAAGVTWVAFIDADEFIVPRTQRIPDMIRSIVGDSDAGGVCLNWQMFGSGGHAEHQESTIRSMTKKLPETHPINHHVKSIVRPERVVRWDNPHRPVLHDGVVILSEDKNNCPDPLRATVSTEVGFIAHYWLKSQNDWRTKINRGRGDGGVSRGVEELKNVDDECVVEDRSVIDVMERMLNH